MRIFPALVLTTLVLLSSVHGGDLPEVVCHVVQTETVVITTILNGRVAPFLVAEVRPQVNGILLARLFEEGSLVKEGDPLYRIDPALYEAGLASAEAALVKAQANRELAEAKEKRYKELVNTHAVSRQEFDEVTAAWKQAEAEVRIAEAQVNTARINLAYTTVTSPITGYIGRSAVTQGALVTASQLHPLATVQRLDTVYVDVAQSTAGLRSLKQALDSGLLHNTGDRHAAVRLIFEDGTPYRHEGELLFSDLTVDQTTGTVVLRAIFPNPETELLPGMFVKAEIQAADKPDAIVIPQQSLLRDGDGSGYVFVVADDGTVERRPVTVLRAIGDRWLTGSGLAAGDRIVTAGFQRVRFIPGAPPLAVRFVEASAP